MSGEKKESFFEGIIDTVDIFNGSVDLSLKGKKTVSSTFGGLLTIGLVVFIFYEFIFQCVSMMDFEDPQLYQINELEEDPAITPLNKQTNFFIAFQVTVDSKNANLTKSSPFNWQSNFKQTHRLINGTKVTTRHPLIWRPCLKADFPVEIYGPNVYSTYDMGTAFCLSGVNYTDIGNGTCPDEVASQYSNCIAPPSFDIKGTYLSEDFEYLQFRVTLCNQSDPTLPANITCDPNVTAKFQTLEFKLTIYYANNVILPTNHSDPNRTIFDTTYWVLNPKISKVADIYVDRVTVQNFDDFIYYDKSENTTFYQISVDKIRELETLTSTGTTKNLLEWNIRRSTLNIVVIRTYAKIIDFLTDLGGFSKALMFIAGFLAMGYVRYKYHVVIANELFDFEMNEPTAESPSKAESVINMTPLSPSHMMVKGVSSPFTSFEVSDTKALMLEHNPSSPVSPFSGRGSVKFSNPALGLPRDNTPVWDYFRKQKNRRNQLDTTTRGFFKHSLSFGVLWCKKKRTRESILTEAAKGMVAQELNVTAIITKVNEVDRLKALMLNPVQTQAFEYIEKPLIEHSRRGLRRMNSTAVSKRSLSSRSSTNGILDNNWKRSRQEKYFKKDFESLPRYERLYTAYQHLVNDTDPTNRKYNKKLLRMMDQDLINVFKRVDMLLHHEPDSDKFEELLKAISEGPKQAKTKNKNKNKDKDRIENKI